MHQTLVRLTLQDEHLCHTDCQREPCIERGVCDLVITQISIQRERLLILLVDVELEVPCDHLSHREGSIPLERTSSRVDALLHNRTAPVMPCAKTKQPVVVEVLE